MSNNNSEPKTILFVDDEIPILKSLNRLFMDTDYEVFTAGSGKEALAILATEKIDMVITDMRMPEMDGCQLLQKVKELHPTSLRIILSGTPKKTPSLKRYKRTLPSFIFLNLGKTIN